MKKRLIAVLMVLILLLSGCSNAEQQTENTQSSQSGLEENIAETLIQYSEGERSIYEDLEAIGKGGNITYNTETKEVSLTIPAIFVKETSQEEIDKKCTRAGMKSGQINQDGSATYVMTEEQHAKMLKELGDTIDRIVYSFVGNDKYPNLTSVTHNETYTEFVITTTSNSVSLRETFASLLFYAYGSVYNLFTLQENGAIKVTFVNATTGAVVTNSLLKGLLN